MYELGKRPTQAECLIAERVDRFWQRVTVAHFIEDECEGDKPTQEEFEEICGVFAERQSDRGEDEWDDLCEAYYDVMREEV